MKRLIKKALALLGLYHPSLGIKSTQETKAAMLLKHKRPGINILVETGTSSGWMIDRIGRSFEKVYSIEWDNDLYERAKERFRNDPHVILFKGDSAIEIEKTLREISRPALFWLDAHASGTISASNSPIIKELEAILKHGVKGHIILIDDARHFDLPTIQMIKTIASHSGYSYQINQGIFILTPC